MAAARRGSRPVPEPRPAGADISNENKYTMAEITAALVKQLRERTGAGMMECKKALVAANGDIGEAEVVLRKHGIASAGKKAVARHQAGTDRHAISTPAASLA